MFMQINIQSNPKEDKLVKKSNFIQAVETELKRLGKNAKPTYWEPQSYIIGKSQSDQTFINLKMPVIRSVLKNDKLFPQGEDLFEQVQDMWFNSNIYEAKTLSLLWMDKKSDQYLLEHQKDLVRWASEIDNWAHSDGLSSMFARIFETNPTYLIKVFNKWNTHKHSWYRRLSLVSLFYYAYSRKNHPEYKLAEKFVTANLNHPEYYVQKGVGWTLREMHNVYPEPTFKYLEKNIKSISSIAWVAATEKLTPQKKSLLLKKRKS